MTPIERAARAISAVGDHRDGSLLLEEFCGYGEDADFVLIARAVLQAIREPSDGMERMGDLQWGDAIAVWQAMIDKALEEG